MEMSGIKLYYNGRILNDKIKIEEYEIDNLSTTSLVASLRGGSIIHNEKLKIAHDKKIELPKAMELSKEIESTQLVVDDEETDEECWEIEDEKDQVACKRNKVLINVDKESFNDVLEAYDESY